MATVKKNLGELIGIHTPRRQADVWEMLDRRPDRFDKKSGDLVGEGEPYQYLLNCKRIMVHDRTLRQAIRFNEFTGRVEVNGTAVTDEEETRLTVWLEETYALRLAVKRVAEILRMVAKDNPYHPVRAYLDGLIWDGESRVRGLFTNYMGAADDEITRELAFRWMLSAVARVFKPGCKVDSTLILVGKQGSLKSTAFRRLSVDESWFSDTPIDMQNKDAYMALQGVWIYELAELDSVRPRDATTVKCFLSSQRDRYRPSYGRNMVDRARCGILVGTTNEAEFLTDRTGSRRFWPVKVGTSGRIDLDAITEDRDQLWAEAVAAFKGGNPWWLQDQEEQDLKESSAVYQQTDPWEVPIREWLKGRQSAFDLADLATDVLKMDRDRQSKGMGMRLAALLKSLGCEKFRVRVGKGDRHWRWKGPDAI